MTLFALHWHVLPGQGVARFGVVEGSGDILPLVEVVALLALRTQTSLVRILMAGSAGLGNADEAPVEVPHLDERAVSRGNVLRCMTLLTFDPSVFSFQHVARLFMIEGLGVPLDDRKIETVVIGVALSAFLTGAGPQTVGEVQAFVSRETSRDLRVTVQALEGSLSAGQLVASDTVRSALKILMRASQWAGRDLSNRSRRQKRHGQGQENRTKRHGS